MKNRLTYFQRIPAIPLILVILAIMVIPVILVAQIQAPRSGIKVVLVEGGSSGMTKQQLESFTANLQTKLSQFSSLSVSFKTEIGKGLTKDERPAFDKCGEPNCLSQYAAKSGMQRLLLFKVTRKEDAYQFSSTEYDVKKSQKLSVVSENAECSSTEELNEFVRAVAVKVGQAVAHVSTVPESLQPQKSNLWWYVGSAAGVGAAAIVYLVVSHSKESAPPKSLPNPPDLP